MRLHRYDVCDSTNERAFAAIADGTARHGDAHVASSQTAGRGRRGRAWFSPLGTGLYASVVWSPRGPSASPEPAALTMAGGLAVLDAARALGIEGAWLKWPNDLIVGDAKLAGVLVEARGLDPARPTYVVGVGLNVRQTEFPAELLAERPVTSLALLGIDTTIDAASEHLLGALADRLPTTSTDPTGLARDFLDATGLAGASVVVDGPDGEVTGTVRGLTIETGLRLDTDVGPTDVPLALVRSVRRATVA